MRVPALSASLLLIGLANGSAPATTPSPVAPLLVLETADDGARADGLVERRVAVYPDGAVIATDGPAAFVHGRLDASALADLRSAAERARLSELPEVVVARARGFDLAAAASTLRWNGASAAVVRVEGDLRRHGPDRAFAPPGFVTLVERVEAIPLAPAAPDRTAPDRAAPGIERVELALADWAERDLTPFADAEAREPLAWPAQVPAPRAGRALAEGAGARALADAARRGRPVAWNGALWRVRARPLFPHESPLDAPPESG